MLLKEFREKSPKYSGSTLWKNSWRNLLIVPQRRPSDEIPESIHYGITGKFHNEIFDEFLMDAQKYYSGKTSNGIPVETTNEIYSRTAYEIPREASDSLVEFLMESIRNLLIKFM